jgi:WD40 repeat protein
MSFRKQKEINGHAAPIYCCVAINNHIYSGSSDKHVARWLLDEGVQDKFAIKFEKSIYSLALIEDNLLAVGLSDGGLHFFNLETREELKYYTQHTEGIFSIHFNPHNNHIYVGDAMGNLSVWDKDGLELLIYLPLDCGKIRSIDSSSSGAEFALACQDGTIRVFETEFFNEIKTFQAHQNGATSVLFHPKNPDQIISGGKDALLKLWDWKKEQELTSVIAHTFAIYDIISIQGGQEIVTASRDKNIKVWKANDLDFIKRLDLKEGGHRHSVNALAKIDESTFVSCSDDKKLIVWEREG